MITTKKLNELINFTLIQILTTVTSTKTNMSTTTQTSIPDNPILNLPRIPLCRIVEYTHSTNILETSKSHIEEREYIRHNLAQNAPEQIYNRQLWHGLPQWIRNAITKRTTLAAFLPLITTTTVKPNNPIEHAIQQYIEKYTFSRKSSYFKKQHHHPHHSKITSCGFGKCVFCHAPTYVIYSREAQETYCRDCLETQLYPRDSPYSNILMLRNIDTIILNLIRDAVSGNILSEALILDVLEHQFD